MAKGILGRKLGMTQIFDAAGNLIPVTIIDATPNVVLQHKTVENDGYVAVQVGFVDKRENLANKPELGHVAKANTAPKRFIREFRFSEAQGNELLSYNVGQEIKCDIFAAGEVVDVTGTSKGHGYTGAMKRWNFGGMRATHGTGPIHRHLGSIGSNTFPGKVFKGKKMAGRWGHETVTVQNLKVVKVDADRNVILVKGAIPGPKGSLVSVKSAVKAN